MRPSYHQVRIKIEDVRNTTFESNYGRRELLVVSIDLTNVQAILMGYVNRTFRPCLDKLVAVYKDDILIYSKSAEEHAEHLRILLSVLSDK